MRKIDTLLEDEAVIDTVVQALEARWPQSRRRGRPGTPADVVLRMLILKNLFDWSYDDLEREVRANLVYRAFTRIDAGGSAGREDDPEDRGRARAGRRRAAAPPGRRSRQACRGHARASIATTRAVLRDAATMVRRLRHRARTASPPIRSMLQRAQDGLVAMRPLVQRVVDQTRARILGGDTHVPSKVLSLFEGRPVTIRKCKIATSNEFGILGPVRRHRGQSDEHRELYQRAGDRIEKRDI